MRARCLPIPIVLALLCVPAGAQVRATPLPVDAARVDAYLAQHLEALLGTYRHLHQNPELSLQEEKTAALVAGQLLRHGYEVHTGVGGHGVVGLLRNGAGPTVMIRGDMDGLPVVEQTGLAYRSQVRAQNRGGQDVGVMHACGHDVHVTSLLGTAGFLAEAREHWAGTVMIVAQPAEELGEGASMMMEAGLFERFARPDYALALHVDPGVEAGKLALVSGWAAANVDSVDVTLHGRGGHGARPHQAVDPVVAAAELITALQTLVSRRVDPQAAAVVTVGSIHGGTKHNVIPDEVVLQITVRSYADDVRQTLLDGIAQLARDVCRAHRCPRPPEVRVKDNYTPAVYNHPELTADATEVFRGALGADAVVPIEPTMGGEDFGRYARALGVPGLLFRLGAVEPSLLRRSQKPGGPALPSLHSSRFAPDAPRAVPTGIKAMSSLALSLLARPR